MTDPRWMSYDKAANERLCKIVEVLAYVKELTLTVEEIGGERGPEEEMFLGPVIQQRDALDHIARAEAVRLGLKKVTNKDEYIKKHLDKAFGHVYRAFFDIADWVGLLYRGKITNFRMQYSKDTMDAVMPEYYQEIVPRVEKISKKIVMIRNGKDVEGERIIDAVKEYRESIETLAEDWDLILGKIASFNLRDKAEREEKKKNTWSKAIWWAITAIIGAVIGVVASQFAK